MSTESNKFAGKGVREAAEQIRAAKDMERELTEAIFEAYAKVQRLRKPDWEPTGTNRVYGTVKNAFAIRDDNGVAVFDLHMSLGGDQFGNVYADVKVPVEAVEDFDAYKAKMEEALAQAKAFGIDTF